MNEVRILNGGTATIADRYAAELHVMADALAARDWDVVSTTAIHLKATERLAERFSWTAVYWQALIGHHVES